MKLTDATAIRVGTTAATKVYLGATQVWPASGGGSSASKTLTIAGRSATRTNFVTRVDLSHLPSDWWASVNSDGGNIRIKSGGVTIPTDLVWINVTTHAGEVFFKAALGTGANVFTVEAVSGATALAATDPNGRNAVWSDYDTALIFNGGDVDRTGKATTITRVGETEYYLTWTQGTALFTPNLTQGIAFDDDGNIIVSDDDELVKYDSTWTEIKRNASPIAASGITVSPSGPGSAAVNHLGAIHHYNGEIYGVLERYTNTTYNNQWVVVYKASDLSFVRAYDISANLHEVSGITHDPTTGKWFITDYDTGRLHRYAADFTYEAVHTTGLSIPQDVTYFDGWLYVAQNTTNGLKRVSPTTGAISGPGSFANVGTLQAVTAYNGELYWLNGAAVYRPTRAALPTAFPKGWLHLTRTGHAKITGIPLRTTWTMGVSGYVGGSAGNNRSAVSYGSDDTNNANRATVSARNSNLFEIWNSTNTWLSSTVAATVDVRRRLVMTQTGTTSRKIYVDGTLRASGATAQRPAGTPAMFIGAEDTDGAERWHGGLNYAYLRNGELDAGWLADEVLSWETPASFYTVS